MVEFKKKHLKNFILEFDSCDFNLRNFIIYKMITSSGCKDIGIKKFEYVPLWIITLSLLILFTIHYSLFTIYYLLLTIHVPNTIEEDTGMPIKTKYDLKHIESCHLYGNFFFCLSNSIVKMLINRKLCI